VGEMQGSVSSPEAQRCGEFRLRGTVRMKPGQRRGVGAGARGTGDWREEEERMWKPRGASESCGQAEKGWRGA
jgi:hypothetical protein